MDFRLADASFDDGYDGIDDGAVFSVTGGVARSGVSFDPGFPAAQLFSPPGAPCSGAGLPWVAPGDAFTAAFTIAVS